MKLGKKLQPNSDPPVSKERQYRIGQLVEVRDSETNEKLAVFRVTKTDDTHINGVIVSVEQWVCEICANWYRTEVDLLAHQFNSSCERDLQ